MDDAMPPEAITSAFRQQGRACRLRRGARLFAAGESVGGLHLVESGHLRIVLGGIRAVVLHYEGPGGMLGETALFGGFPYPATAIASEPTVCQWLPRPAVLRLVAEEPPAAEFFLRRLAQRLHGVIARLDPARVSERLMRHIVARPGALEGRVFSLGMTQAELAEELGTVREVVVRELRRLVERGAIASAGRGRYRMRDGAEPVLA
jgi:CRP/FNR family transcriptional regulator